MTIRLPGIAEQLAPSMEGIGSFLKNLANPNYDQQAALREALLAGRIQYDDLAKMSDDDVERQFGKGTAKLKPKDRQPTMKDMVDKYGAQEVGRRMSLPDGSPEKEELRAGITPGGMRPNQRTIEQQNVTQGNQAIKEGDAKLAETERRTKNILLHSNVVKRLEAQGAGKNIYMDYKNGLIKPEEKSELMANDEFRARWDRESSEYWNGLMDNYRHEALNERTDPVKLKQQFNRAIAERYAERANNLGVLADVNDVISVIENPELMKLWGDKEAPANPESAKIWSAVQAVKKSMTVEGDTDRKKAITTAHEIFRKNAQGILAQLSSEQNRAKMGGDTEVAAQIERLNKLAQQTYSGVLPANEIPVFAFDKKHPSVGKGIFIDDKVFYQKSGNSEASLIPDAAIPVVNTPTPTPASNAQAAMSAMAAKAVKEGKVQEALATAPDSTLRAQLAAEIAKIGGDTTTVKRDTVPKEKSFGELELDRVGNIKKSQERISEIKQILKNLENVPDTETTTKYKADLKKELATLERR
jgi:hypothetical protein